MKLKKIIAALLSAVMVVSLVPAMLFSVSANDDPAGTTPAKVSISNPFMSPDKLTALNAFDDNPDSCADGGNQSKEWYVGGEFLATPTIEKVSVSLSGEDTDQKGQNRYRAWCIKRTLEFSADGKNWVVAAELKYLDSNEKEVQEVAAADFSAEAKAMTDIKYIRVRQAIPENFSISKRPTAEEITAAGGDTAWLTDKTHTGLWERLRVYDLSVYGTMDAAFTTCEIESNGAEGTADTVVAKVKLADTSVQLKEAALTFQYDKNILAYGDDTTGNIALNIKAADVKEDGTLAELTFTRKNVNQSAKVEFSVAGIGKTADDKAIGFSKTTTSDVQLGDQQTGLYLTDSEAIAFNKSEGETKPASQKLFEGKAILTNNGQKTNGVTLVYKIDGIEEGKPIVVNGLNFAVNGNVTGNFGNYLYINKPWMPTIAEDQKGSMEMFSFTENGYLFLYQNSRIFDGNATNHMTSLEGISVFDGQASHNQKKNEDGTYKADSYKMPEGSNTNANATFQLLAIVADNLAPTVTFYGKEYGAADNTAIATYTHKYSEDINASIEDPAKVRIGGKLTNAKAMFEAMNAAIEEEADKIAVPTKASTINKVTYEFENWVDEEGNVVDNIYMSTSVYPKFKTIDNRADCKIKFVNEDGTVLEEKTIKEGEKIEYKGETPKKASTDTNSFRFKGWTPELTADAVATADATYTAAYDMTDRKYDVTFMDDDKTTKLGEVLGIDRGGKAEIANPSKDATAQYTYTFEKWVDKDGKDVNLNNVTADMTVYAKYTQTVNQYTVTFMQDDKTTKISDVKVDYGAKATVANPTKAKDAYTYTFDKWVDEAGKEVKLGETEIKANVTYYASYRCKPDQSKRRLHLYIRQMGR